MMARVPPFIVLSMTLPRPVLSPDMSVRDRVRAIQDYLDALEYNHTGFQFFM